MCLDSIIGVRTDAQEMTAGRLTGDISRRAASALRGAHIIPDTGEGVLGGIDILFRRNGTVLSVSYFAQYEQR